MLISNLLHRHIWGRSTDSSNAYQALTFISQLIKHENKNIHQFRLPNFVANFLSNRSFKVRIGSTLSDTFKQEQCVPQGSILSPTLFNIKINNIVKCVYDIDSSLYVDDFGIFYFKDLVGWLFWV